MEIPPKFRNLENTLAAVEDAVEEDSLVKLFEDIPDDAVVIKVKFNKVADDEFYPGVKRYVEEYCKAEILYSTAGIHKNGKSAVPHIHYHFITRNFKSPINPSEHRKRWIRKDPQLNNLGKHCSIQFSLIDNDKPKYHVLAYPLKEGLVNEEIKNFAFYDYQQEKNRMKKRMYNFLMGVGKEIYDKAMAAHDRVEKCLERKQVKLTDLFNLCRDNKFAFSNYTSMKIWLDSNYIDKLELSELPDSRNYKNNCEKVAVKLGLLKYSDII